MKKKEYEALLKPLQIELNNLARWLSQTGTRMMVLFEGRDTAGKGGTIGAISKRMNPRRVHTVALPTPPSQEHYEGPVTPVTDLFASPAAAKG